MAVQLLEEWLLKEQKKAQENFEVLNRVGLADPEIILIGDSVIDYYPIHELLKTDKVMVNRGIKGYKTYQLLENLSLHVYGHRLEKVFILLGTNDLGMEMPIEETIENMEYILQMIARSNSYVDVYLVSVLPVNEAERFKGTVYVRRNDAIQKMNAAYQALAEEHSHVHYVDAYTNMLDDLGQLQESYTQDGLHLTIDGYVALSQALQPYVNQ